MGHEKAWEQKELDFDADMEDRAEIAADPALMELVWDNLLSNAVKFTEPGGSIMLTETSDDENIYVSVRDTGCGMSEETKKISLRNSIRVIPLMQWRAMALALRWRCGSCS